MIHQGWSFEDHMGVLLNPESKLHGIKELVMTMLYMPIILFYVCFWLIACGVVGIVLFEPKTKTKVRLKHEQS